MVDAPAGLRARRESALKSAMDSLQRFLPAAKYSLRHPQALFSSNAWPVILRKVVRCSSGAIPREDRRISLAGTPRRGRGGRARRPGSSYGALSLGLLFVVQAVAFIEES